MPRSPGLQVLVGTKRSAAELLPHDRSFGLALQPVEHSDTFAHSQSPDAAPKSPMRPLELVRPVGRERM